MKNTKKLPILFSLIAILFSCVVLLYGINILNNKIGVSSAETASTEINIETPDVNSADILKKGDKFTLRVTITTNRGAEYVWQAINFKIVPLNKAGEEKFALIDKFNIDGDVQLNVDGLSSGMTHIITTDEANFETDAGIYIGASNKIDVTVSCPQEIIFTLPMLVVEDIEETELTFDVLKIKTNFVQYKSIADDTDKPYDRANDELAYSVKPAVLQFNVSGGNGDSTVIARPKLNKLEIDKYSIYSDEAQTQVLNTKDAETLKNYTDLHTDYVPMYFSIEFEDQFIYLDIATDDAKAKVRNNINNMQIEGAGVLKVSVEDVLHANATAHINLTVFSDAVTSGAIHYILYVTRLPEKTNNTDAEIYFDEEQLFGFNDEYAADSGKKVVYGTKEKPYLYSVPYNMNSLTITVNVNPNAGELVAVGTFRVINNEQVVIKDKENASSNKFEVDYGINVVKVEITAGDGVTQKVIAILINREKAVFNSITIDEIPDFKYNSEQFKNENEQVDYSCSVDSGVSELTLNIDVNEDYGLSYDVIGNVHKLDKGHNTIYIYLYESPVSENGEISPAALTVAAQDNTKQLLRTLVLNVYREPKDNSLVWTVFFFIFLALVIIETILLILMITSNNRKEEKDVKVVEITPEPQPPVIEQKPTILQPIIQQVPVQPIIQQVPVQQGSAQPPVNVMVKLNGPADKDGFYDNYSNINTNK